MVALTWGEVPAPGSAGSAPTFATESLRGSGVAEGQLALIAALVGVALVQVGFRPAWIAGGFIVAVLGRELIGLLGDDHASAGIGLWLGVAAALAAAVVLIWDMAASIERSPAAAEG